MASKIMTLEQIEEERSKNKSEEQKSKEQGYREQRLAYVREMVRFLMPQLPYHNFKHATEVYSAAMTYATLEKISQDDRFVLGSAAWMHDVIFRPNAKDNEERSAELSRLYLPQIGYTTAQSGKVSQIVLATKMPTHPQGLLEEIICDSDIDNIGTQDFIGKNELIREELGVPENYDWYENNIKFLKSQKFYTASAKRYREYGVLLNIKLLQDLCNAYGNDRGVGNDETRRAKV